MAKVNKMIPGSEQCWRCCREQVSSLPSLSFPPPPITLHASWFPNLLCICLLCQKRPHPPTQAFPPSLSETHLSSYINYKPQILAHILIHLKSLLQLNFIFSMALTIEILKFHLYVLLVFPDSISILSYTLRGVQIYNLLVGWLTGWQG